MILAPAADAVDRFRADLLSLIGDESPGLGLAVSGGADSLALLLLAQAGFAGRIRAATVDHRLRPEASDEAVFVESLCHRLGIPHDTLRPEAPITGNLQSSARQARYDLLAEWRRRHRLKWLATAHHADDQAETLLMRLNRGSGVGGLSAIRSVNGSVIRPLLGWRRSDLEAIVERAGIEPVDDPSNKDERFDRARIRRQLREVDWIDRLGVARSAAALGEAEEALEWSTGRLWRERSVEVEGRLRLDVGQLPREFRRRLVRRALEKLAPGCGIRGEDLGRFISALESGRAATLAGVKGMAEGEWHFTLAPPRRR